MDPRHHLAEESGSWFSLIQTLFYFLTVLNFVVISHFRHSIVKLRFWLEIFIFSIKIKILFLKDQDFFYFFLCCLKVHLHLWSFLAKTSSVPFCDFAPPPTTCPFIFMPLWVTSGNAKGGSITVPLTSCLTGLD